MPRNGWWSRRHSRRLRIPTNAARGACRHIQTIRARIGVRRIERIQRPGAGGGFLRWCGKVPWGFLVFVSFCASASSCSLQACARVALLTLLFLPPIAPLVCDDSAQYKLLKQQG